MAQISQLILGETGCVSYIISCTKEKEAAIIDAFQGFESNIEKELERLQHPEIKHVIDTHTHAETHRHTHRHTDADTDRHTHTHTPTQTTNAHNTHTHTQHINVPV